MEVINAIGRRKSSVARVYVSEGTGKITINKKDLEVYFPSAILQYVVKQPLNLLEVAAKYDIKANLDGGGFTGQSQALRLAIARALVKINEEDKKKLKDLMTIALICSFIILIIKMIVSSGASGTASALTGARLPIAAVLCFITGIINMFGIPMKPTWTAMFLILGLSPISTLTMVQSVGYFGPMSGGYNILKSGNYHYKTVLCAALAGTAGAFIGVSLALTLSAGLLNIILLAVMALAIVSMARG